jgi:hypothetical protein
MKLIDNTTASVDAEWTEPSTNPDGSPLQDLAYSSVYYKVNGGATIVGAKINATKLQGGGLVKTTLIVPAPTGGTVNLEFWATATDTAGNESLPTVKVPFSIERLAPSSPQSFTVG